MNILFDLDGTLIDSSERLYRLFQNIVLESTFTKEDYWNLKRNRNNHEMILSKYFPHISFNDFNNMWMKKIEDEKYLAMDCNYDNTIDVLTGLKKENDLFLLTARQSRVGLINELDRLGLIHFFRAIMTTEGRKTKTAIVKESMKDGILEKDDGDVFVSDMGRDIDEGKDLGYITIGITHGFMNRSGLLDYRPDYIVDNLYEVREIICGLSNEK